MALSTVKFVFCWLHARVRFRILVCGLEHSCITSLPGVDRTPSTDTEYSHSPLLSPSLSLSLALTLALTLPCSHSRSHSPLLSLSLSLPCSHSRSHSPLLSLSLALTLTLTLTLPCSHSPSCSRTHSPLLSLSRTYQDQAQRACPFSVLPKVPFTSFHFFTFLFSDFLI
jgi:hypothetical protein